MHALCLQVCPVHSQASTHSLTHSLTHPPTHLQKQYNYGQPRVGNAALAQYISAQAPAQGPNYRATHTDDPVPRLPDTAMGYAHSTPEYWISRGADDVQTGDVVVFEAADDRRGNAGTGWFDVGAHMHYFGPISVC